MKAFSLQSRSTRYQRGAAAPVVIAVIVILILVAVAAWYLIFRPSQTAAVVPVQAPVATTSSAPPPPPPANVDAMSVNQLLDEAGKAMHDQRLLAPAGNNAFEFYLKVLAKDPNNRAAQDALRETFPFGANAAEQEINAGNFDEAEREIGILAKADPGNYTLTILRSKLDAQRKLLAQQAQQEQLAQEQAARQAAAAAASAAAAARQQQAQAAAAAVAAQQQSTQQSATQQSATQTAAPVAAPKPAPVVSQPARLVKNAAARYPRAALRRRQEGWVDVQFTVDPQGQITNAHVVNSSNGRVFNRAALDAVREREYAPATRNGQPVSSVLTQRIVFKL